MNWFEVLGISIGLAMDAFAVAVAAGISLGEVTRRHTFRLAFHFGLFQFMMPLLGWLAGTRMSGCVAGYDRLAAFVLLSLVGVKMLWDARRDDSDRRSNDPTRGLMLLTLSLATSVDALAVGVSMALLRVPIWTLCAVIGLVAATMTTLGIRFGARLGPRWEHRAEMVGGGVLLLIAAQTLISYWTARPGAL